jgi:hypothetical protein
MQALAWLGFAVGMTLLLLTGSSVIKTLLIAAGYRHPAAYARLMTCANT